MALERRSIQVLLSKRVAEDINDSRALAATVLLDVPDDMKHVEVQEFLGWIQGSSDRLVREYQRAATIGPGARMGELRPFQRAALIGALRLRRQLERSDGATG